MYPSRESLFADLGKTPFALGRKGIKGEWDIAKTETNQI